MEKREKKQAHYLKQLFFSVKDVFFLICPSWLAWPPRPEIILQAKGESWPAYSYGWVEQTGDECQNCWGAIVTEDRNNMRGRWEVAAGIWSWSWGGLVLAAAGPNSVNINCFGIEF